MDGRIIVIIVYYYNTTINYRLILSIQSGPKYYHQSNINLLLTEITENL